MHTSQTNQGCHLWCLQAFLTSPALQTQGFAINQHRRKHLHRTLDATAAGMVRQQEEGQAVYKL
jgi:hypothetical protein